MNQAASPETANHVNKELVIEVMTAVKDITVHTRNAYNRRRIKHVQGIRIRKPDRQLLNTYV